MRIDLMFCSRGVFLGPSAALLLSYKINKGFDDKNYIMTMQVRFGSASTATFYGFTRFQFFFFFCFSRTFLLNQQNILFTGITNYIFQQLFTLKMGPTILFTHLKIILLRCFQVQQNKFYPNRPVVVEFGFHYFPSHKCYISSFKYIQIDGLNLELRCPFFWLDYFTLFP